MRFAAFGHPWPSLPIAARSLIPILLVFRCLVPKFETQPVGVLRLLIYRDVNHEAIQGCFKRVSGCLPVGFLTYTAIKLKYCRTKLLGYWA